MAEGDSAKVAVPIELGIGLLVLFTLPNLSDTAEDWYGDTYTVSANFGEVRTAAQYAGVEWTIWIALLGVVAAIFAALFFRSDGTQPRSLVMGLGSLMGLFYPTGIAIMTGGNVFTDMLPRLSWGIWLFWLACIIAAAAGFQSVEQETSRTPRAGAPAYLSAPLASPTWLSAYSNSGQRVQTMGQVDIREFPESNAPVLSQATAGSPLILQERVTWSPRPSWIKVRDDRNETVGYVKGTMLKPI